MRGGWDIYSRRRLDDGRRYMIVPISIAACTAVARSMAVMDFMPFAVALLMRLRAVAASWLGLSQRQSSARQRRLLPHNIDVRLRIFRLLVEEALVHAQCLRLQIVKARHAVGKRIEHLGGELGLLRRGLAPGKNVALLLQKLCEQFGVVCLVTEILFVHAQGLCLVLVRLC